MRKREKDGGRRQRAITEETFILITNQKDSTDHLPPFYFESQGQCDLVKNVATTNLLPTNIKYASLNQNKASVCRSQEMFFGALFVFQNFQLSFKC